MLKRMLLTGLALMTIDAYAARAVIQVDLNARLLRLETFEGNKRRKLDIGILPAVADSFHADTFVPYPKIYRRFRSIGGNVYLQNVIYFDGNRSIRTATPEAQKRGDRPSSQIAIDPDYGSLVFDTIRRVGPQNTSITIIKKGEGPAHH